MPTAFNAHDDADLANGFSASSAETPAERRERKGKMRSREGEHREAPSLHDRFSPIASSPVAFLPIAEDESEELPADQSFPPGEEERRVQEVRSSIA